LELVSGPRALVLSVVALAIGLIGPQALAGASFDPATGGYSGEAGDKRAIHFHVEVIPDEGRFVDVFSYGGRRIFEDARLHRDGEHGHVGWHFHHFAGDYNVWGSWSSAHEVHGHICTSGVSIGGPVGSCVGSHPYSATWHEPKGH
jgi:hypothetical protein